MQRLDFPTAYGMTALAGFTLAWVLWLLARHHRGQGVFVMVTACLLFGAAYALFVLIPVLGLGLAMTAAYGCLSLAIALVTLSLSLYSGQQLKAWVHYALVGGALLCWLAITLGANAPAQHALRARLQNLQFLLQMSVSMAVLWRIGRHSAGNGWKIVFIGIVLQALALLPMALFGDSALVRSTGNGSWTRMLVPWLICLVMFLNLQMGAIGFLLMLRDREAQGDRDHALRDPLTGLFNRRALDARLDNALAQARTSGQPMAILMIDIDHFKRVNDHHGHVVGDHALQHVGHALESMLRHNDMVARYGGEEFVVLLESTDDAEARHLATRLLETVRNTPMSLDNASPLPLTVSIGLHVARPGPDTQREAIVQAADAALYCAKAAGRNCVAMHQGPDGITLLNAEVE